MEKGGRGGGIRTGDVQRGGRTFSCGVAQECSEAVLADRGPAVRAGTLTLTIPSDIDGTRLADMIQPVRIPSSSAAAAGQKRNKIVSEWYITNFGGKQFGQPTGRVTKA